MIIILKKNCILKYDYFKKTMLSLTLWRSGLNLKKFE